jgi:hypothetical protein
MILALIPHLLHFRLRRRRLEAAAVAHQLLAVAAGGAGESLPVVPLPRRLHAGGHGAQARPQGVQNIGKRILAFFNFCALNVRDICVMIVVS